MHLSFSSVLKKHLYCLSAMRSTTVTLMVLHSEWHCRLQALPEPQISLTAETNQPLKQKSSLCLWKSKYSLKLVSQITSPWIQSYNSPMLSNFSFLVYLEGIGHLHLSYFPPCFAGTLFFLLFFNFYLFFFNFYFPIISFHYSEVQVSAHQLGILVSSSEAENCRKQSRSHLMGPLGSTANSQVIW